MAPAVPAAGAGNVRPGDSSQGEIALKSFIIPLSLAGLTAGLLMSQIGYAESGDGQAKAGSAVSAPVPAGMVRGEVLETMNSGGYTYLLIETDGDKRWLVVVVVVVEALVLVEVVEVLVVVVLVVVVVVVVMVVVWGCRCRRPIWCCRRRCRTTLTPRLIFHPRIYTR